MAFDFLYNSSSDGKLFKKECDFIHEVADKVIDSRRKALVISHICLLKIFSIKYAISPLWYVIGGEMYPI